MYNYPIQLNPSLSIQPIDNGYIIRYDDKIYCCNDADHLLTLIKEKLSTKKEGDK